jgi:hypothetical protein
MVVLFKKKIKKQKKNSDLHHNHQIKQKKQSKKLLKVVDNHKCPFDWLLLSPQMPEWRRGEK